MLTTKTPDGRTWRDKLHYLGPWLSIFFMCQKHQIAEPILQLLIQKFWIRAQEFAFLT